MNISLRSTWAIPKAVIFASTLPLLFGCSTIRGGTDAGKSIAGMTVSEGKTVIDAAVETFAMDLKTSATDKTSVDKGAQMFLSGRAMLDLQCSRYMTAIGDAIQVATNERQQVGLIGGFTSAIMGLTGNTAKQIAGVATTFSFVGSSMDSYTTSYLFSDAATSVGTIVSGAQSAYLSSIEENIPRLGYADAVALLTGYEALCRPAQIRTLIDDAVAKATIVAKVKAPLPSDQEMASVLATLAVVLGRPISEAEAINLYAWFTSPAERSTGPKLENNDPIPALKAGPPALSDADLQKQLVLGFMPVSLASSSIPARWAVALTKLKTTPMAAHVITPNPAAALVAPASAAPLLLPTPTPRIIHIPLVKVL